MLRVRLEYAHPWTNHAGMYLARERGYYADYGMDVEFTSGDFFRGDPAYLLAGERSTSRWCGSISCCSTSRESPRSSRSPS